MVFYINGYGVCKTEKEAVYECIKHLYNDELYTIRDYSNVYKMTLLTDTIIKDMLNQDSIVKNDL
jgi:hypothetical protein